MFKTIWLHIYYIHPDPSATKTEISDSDAFQAFPDNEYYLEIGDSSDNNGTSDVMESSDPDEHNNHDSSEISDINMVKITSYNETIVVTVSAR